ncbi:MAG: hypothetical protein ACRD3C_13100 [Vicinamibacterales bacterium]
MRDLFEGRPVSVRDRGESPDVGTDGALHAQQGIAHRLMTPEEMFPRGIMTKVVI